MTFAEINACNVCGSNEISSVYYIPDFPTILRPLSCDSIDYLRKKKISPTMPLKVGICHQCGHMLLLLRPANETLHYVYECLYETYVSGLELGFATADADEFLQVFREHIAPKVELGSRILEIGCYDGYVLSYLMKDRFEVLGCDPSDGARIGQERGIPIIRAFYSPNLFQTTFDVVINRHLIEHFDQPVDFATSIREVVKARGYLIIETPNGTYYLEHHLIDPFHLEHLSVFTPISLASCIRRAGFCVRQMFSDSRNLRVVCALEGERGDDDVDIPEIESVMNKAVVLNHRISEYLSRLNSFVEDFVHQGATVAVWGAGSFGITVLSLASSLSGRVVAVVDRDSRKQGRSFFNLDIKVKPPEYLADHPVDLIIICSQYSSEILSDIRSRYKLRSAVLILAPKIELLK